eukprot:TRINITY_DN3117_c0_g1_i2.p1 TRINITY_DN3117_c0_g1~~TRINITY_DN3117_c0_g1_i2.p1  ORF type:complete len:794 (-),score=300.53 TRINITY_DN3117_c0_g1_i2:47-2206(-)
MSKDHPQMIRSSSKQIKEFSAELKGLEEKRGKLEEELREEEKKHEPVANVCSELLDSISKMSKTNNYMRVVVKIERLKEAAFRSLSLSNNSSNEELDECLKSFLSILSIQKKLEGGNCFNLKRLIKTYVDSLTNRILSVLKVRFKKVLEEIQWSSNSPGNIMTKEDYDSLNYNLSFLLQLQKSLRGKEVEDNREDSLWAMDFLLHPLITRFNFNFRGEKQTNNLEKPEWYFTNVLNTISSRSDFLLLKIQPIFNDNDMARYDAKEEFIKGMVKAVNSKLSHDLNTSLKENPPVFYHTLNEAISFERSLIDLHEYPQKDIQDWSRGSLDLNGNDSRNPSVLDPFTESREIFDLWITQEAQYLQRNLHKQLKDNSNWNPRYNGSLQDADYWKCPLIADLLVSTLHNETERLKMLPNVEHRFVIWEKVEMVLLQDFYEEILENSQYAFKWSSASHSGDHFKLYSQYINALRYVEKIVEDWGEQIIFLEIQLYRQQKEEDHPSNLSLLNVEGSVFSKTEDAFKELRKEIIANLAGICVKSFQDFTKDYFRKRVWSKSLFLDNQKNIVEDALEISPEISEALYLLKGRFRMLQEELNESSFMKLWKSVAYSLNRFIIQQILSKFYFQVDSIAQFGLDMKALFFIFKSFTSNPESHFKDLKEALIILEMNSSKLKQFKKLLSSGSKSWNAESLIPFGIQKLDKLTVEKVLEMMIPDTTGSFLSKG